MSRVDEWQVREVANATNGTFPPTPLMQALAQNLLEARATVATLIAEVAALTAERDDLLEAAVDMSHEERDGMRCPLCSERHMYRRGVWREKPCPLAHDDTREPFRTGHVWEVTA